MAEDRSDMALRLLREIRNTRSGHTTRFTKLGRQMSEKREVMFTAMAMVGRSQVVTEGHGERFDELTDEITALKRRVSELERQE